MPTITPIKFVPPGPCRLSYVQLFEPAAGPDPDQDPVRSVSLLFPKSDTKTIQTIANNLTAMANACVANKLVEDAGQLKMPARDGDAEVKMKNRGQEYAGMIFMNAKSWRPVGIVNGQNQPILDPDELYSGCWANVQISFKYYNTRGNRGIRVEINLVQKVRDDERFDGVDKAEDVFTVVDTPPDSDVNAVVGAKEAASTITIPGTTGAPAPSGQPSPAGEEKKEEAPATGGGATNPFANLI